MQLSVGEKRCKCTDQIRTEQIGVCVEKMETVEWGIIRVKQNNVGDAHTT